MKKAIIVLLAMLASSTAVSEHSYHTWHLISVFEVDFGYWLCTYECRGYTEPHFTVTRGLGRCRSPSL